METTLIEVEAAVETQGKMRQGSKEAGERQPRTEADFLRMAADRRERHGEPVTALLFRNEACRLEGASWEDNHGKRS